MRCNPEVGDYRDAPCIVSGEFTTAEGYRVTLTPLPDGRMELRYCDSTIDESYRSWKFSPMILTALMSFWNAYRSDQFPLPVSERVTAGEFRMLSKKSVSIKESDLYGNLKMIGAELPTDLVEALHDNFREAFVNKNHHSGETP